MYDGGHLIEVISVKFTEIKIKHYGWMSISRFSILMSELSHQVTYCFIYCTFGFYFDKRINYNCFTLFETNAICLL